MYLDKSFLNSLTKEEVTKVVMSLGSNEPKTDSNGNLIFQTVCHGGDSYKLYYYHDAIDDYKGKTFHCYTKCSESFSLIELVIRAKRTQGITMTWYKALYYIGKITNKLSEGTKEEDIDKKDLIDFSWVYKFDSKKSKAVPNLSTINENILDIFCYYPHEDWVNDNCSMEALSKMEIGYWGEQNAITIPHRDWKNGNLIGVRLRYLDELDIKNVGKYVPAYIGGRFLNHQLGSNIYGLHITKETIVNKKKILLFEAEKSLVQALSYFGDDCFCGALCGSAITVTHIKIILDELQVSEVIYAPDRDYHEANSFEAEEWYNRQILKLAPLVPYTKVYLIADRTDELGYKDSPSDHGKDTLLRLLDEKILIDMDEVIRVQKERRG